MNRTETKAIKKIHLACAVFSNGILTILYSVGEYPTMYYKMIGDVRPISTLPIGSWFLSVTIILLISTFFISMVTSKYYLQEDTSDHTRKIPKEMRLIAWMVVSFFAISVMIGVLVNVAEDGKFWGILLFFQLMTGVMIPFLIIVTSPQLYAYSKNFYPKWSEAMLGIILRLRLFNLNPQIHPIE